VIRQERVFINVALIQTVRDHIALKIASCCSVFVHTFLVVMLWWLLLIMMIMIMTDHHIILCLNMFYYFMIRQWIWFVDKAW